jgi:DNA-binding transcriptional ArsR family regulator
VPVDPSRLNAVGDFVVAHDHEFRALADELTLTVFDEVRRHRHATTAEVAGLADAEPAAVDSKLRTLESLGLVERSEDGQGWSATVRGVYFEIPADPGAQRSARDLSNVMLAKYASLPLTWVADHEQELDLEWARAAGLFNARVSLTPDELRRIQAELEELLEPYTTRSAGAAPPGAAPVRVLAYFLPEIAPSAAPA